MFDDLETAEQKSEGLQSSPEDEQNSHWGIGRWAHIITIPVFCLLYFPFEDHTWAWPVAITMAYIVFMLCCTCGIAFRDSDDLFGNLRVPEYMGKLLLRQILVLALVSVAAWSWRYAKTVLPEWAVHEGRRMSLWDYLGMIVFYIVAVREASWMASKIKQHFP